MSSQTTSFLTTRARVEESSSHAVKKVLGPTLLIAVLLVSVATMQKAANPLDWLFVCVVMIYLSASVYTKLLPRVASPLRILDTVCQLQVVSLGLGLLAMAWASAPVRHLSWGCLFAAAAFVARGRLSLPKIARSSSHHSHSSLLVMRSLASYKKRTFDLLVSSLILLALSPFFLLIALAILIDSGSPVFFRQQRVGHRGKAFHILKFRSMFVTAPRYERSPIDDRDPRITRVGRVLRRLSLDELPQLLNVLRGEMSLVGPRPEMPFLVRQYRAKHRDRLSAVPGLTGLWQISPARARPIHKSPEYDAFYMAHQSFFLDLAILCRTVGAVFRGIGAR